MRRLHLWMILLLLLPVTVYADELPRPIRTAYDDDLRVQQALNLYLPEQAAPPYPTILMIHGGGFLDGSLQTLSPLARAFQREGYAVVNITYRLVPDGIYPAPVEDAFCALAWVAANAREYDLDMRHLFLLGESAGGYLATRMATEDEPEAYLTGCPNAELGDMRLRGAVVYFPIIDFNADDFQPIGGALGNALFDGPDALRQPVTDERREQLAAINALNDIDSNTPPFLVIHGTDDSLVPPTQSSLLVDALKAVGVPADILLIRDADHGFAPLIARGPGAEALAAVLAFMGERLN
ncbi:MAG: alpha/beta hydrolase [Chloroflexota bacterium]|nr:alpha/beta hydrolase [Chloroflexota bacterium]